MRGARSGRRGMTEFATGHRGAMAPRPRDSERAMKTESAFTRALIASGARHIIDFADARKIGGRSVPNRVYGVQPLKNLVCFPTGPIANESGGTTPTKVNCSTVNTDPSGTTNRATRLTATANNQTFLFYSIASGITPPSGVYGMRFRARVPTGGASFTLSYGLSSGMVTQTVQDLDWSNSANDVATTFETEFTFTGGANMQIRLPTTGADMLIDRIQIYPGGLKAIPPWATEAVSIAGGGAKRAYTFDNCIPLDTAGSWNHVDLTGGMILREPGLADTTYSAITVMVVASMDAYDAAETIQYVFASQADSRLGSTVNSFHIGYEDGAANENRGHIKFSPISNFRAQSLLGVKGHGSLVFGQSYSASGSATYVDEIPILSDSTAFTPVTQTHWRIGSASTSAQAQITTSEHQGKLSMIVVWPRQLTDTEWAYWARILRKRCAARGVAMAPFKDFHVLSGDSNWTKATNDWLQLLELPDTFTPNANLWGRDTSVGGTGVAEVYGANPYPTLPESTGRLLSQEAPKLLAAAKAGRRAIYHLGWVTNDFFEISGIPAWGTAAYDATRDYVVKYLLNLHPLIYVIEYTCLARGTASGSNYTPAVRLTVNANIRARQALDTTGRHFLCDVGGPSCVLGDQTQVDTTNLYLVGDTIHLNGVPGGDTQFANFTKPVIDSVRRALGVGS